MTVENAGLDLYTAKLQAGEHSTLNPWDAEFAEVKKQLGNWRVAIEGWEDTYGHGCMTPASRWMYFPTWRTP